MTRETDTAQTPYPRSARYADLIRGKIMGPNPLKLAEELMAQVHLATDSTVMDLGSGIGITSVFLAKEYGLKITAADLWSEPAENQEFFAACGLDTSRITAVKADATALPFPPETFDAVVCVDSYNKSE